MADRRVCRRRPAPDTVRLVQGAAWGGLAQSRQRSGVAVGCVGGQAHRNMSLSNRSSVRGCNASRASGFATWHRSAAAHSHHCARSIEPGSRLVFALHFHDQPVVQALDPKMRRASVVSFGIGIGL